MFLVVNAEDYSKIAEVHTLERAKEEAERNMREELFEDGDDLDDYHWAQWDDAGRIHTFGEEREARVIIAADREALRDHLVSNLGLKPGELPIWLHDAPSAA